MFTTLSTVGQKAEKKWTERNDELKAFAHMAVSWLVGCSFCLDFGHFMTHHNGLDEAKASEVPRWRESDVFTTRERDVMEYAAAMSQTPPTVTDERRARLLEALGPALIELTAFIEFANPAADPTRRWASNRKASRRCAPCLSPKGRDR